MNNAIDDKETLSRHFKNEIDKEMKKRTTILDEETIKKCGEKIENHRLLLIAVTRKVKKDYSDKNKTMKNIMKDNEKNGKLLRKNAEIAFKLQMKASEKEEKDMRKNAEKAFKLQMKNEKKKEKKVVVPNLVSEERDEEKIEKKNELQMKKTTIDDSVVMDYLQRIVNENKKNDKKLFEGLEKKKNITKKKKELKNIGKVFDKQVVNYLNTVCTDSGECLAFGRENANIKKIFSDFVDFRHLKKVSNAGSPSANGFVLNLHYESMNYKSNALLKSSQNKRSDNLYYEYLVGTLFINKMNEIFPCFTETYHLFKHQTEKTKDLLQQNKVGVSKYSTYLSVNSCDASVREDPFLCIDKSCEDGVSFAILVQYISNPISVASFMAEHGNDKLFEGQMICILFQIYSCLSYLQDHFTHYDLHTNNVLLYKLPKGKYVRIDYIDERSGETVSIKTNYIAKMIDYGRCYFGNLGNNGLASSVTIADTIFNSEICSKIGPRKVGYNFFGDKATESNSYTSSILRNKSHDLRFANIVSKRSKKMAKIFQYRPIIFTEKYGTKEKESDGSYFNLNNVSDMYQYLGRLYDDDNSDGIVSVASQDTSVGTIVVNMTKKLCEKKMVFVP